MISWGKWPQNILIWKRNLNVLIKLSQEGKIDIKQGCGTGVNGFGVGCIDRSAPRKPRLLRRGRGELYEIEKNPYREAPPFRAGSFTMT
jgi:hypothetical protein